MVDVLNGENALVAATTPTPHAEAGEESVNGLGTPSSLSKNRKLTKNQMKRERKKSKKQAARETSVASESDNESVSMQSIRPVDEVTAARHANCVCRLHLLLLLPRLPP